MERILQPMDSKRARMKNPLVLAYIGDTIYDLYFRMRAVKEGEAHVHELNKKVSAEVNAHAQSVAAARIEELLSEEEADIFRRGRNAKSVTSPKNMDIVDYRRATGLEALMGYLYLTGQNERIDELMDMIMERKQEK